MSKTEFTFDEKKHEYRVNGYPVPSVTQVLSDVLPTWKATEWYLNRGRAIHAGCAMILRGQEFTCDPRIEGQITACRKFLRTHRPTIIAIEKPSFSHRYHFAGTPDSVVCGIEFSSVRNNAVLVDWKSSLHPSVIFQLAAYGLLEGVDYGLAVQLNDDGTYNEELYSLKYAKREFLSLLTVYNIRKRLKLTEKETDGKTGDY